MTSEQKSAYIQSQCVCATAELMGMFFFNQVRLSNNESPGYDERNFLDVIVAHGLHQNQVLEFFREQ